MKKAFEFLLVLIIFYGVYAGFDRATVMFTEKPQTVWIALTSFIASALILVVYNLLLSATVKNSLQKEIKDLQSEIQSKDLEIITAKSFKETLIAESEKSEKAE